MKLKTARLALMWSVGELAKKASCSYATIARIEGGGKVDRMATVRKISKALGLAPQEIDEFQHLVGTPADLVAELTAEEKAEIDAMLEAAEQTELISEEEYRRRLAEYDAERAKLAA